MQNTQASNTQKQLIAAIAAIVGCKVSYNDKTKTGRSLKFNFANTSEENVTSIKNAIIAQNFNAKIVVKVVRTYNNRGCCFVENLRILISNY
jgi:hypothetical protein